MMVIIYYKVFRVIRSRAAMKKSSANKYRSNNQTQNSQKNGARGASVIKKLSLKKPTVVETSQARNDNLNKNETNIPESETQINNNLDVIKLENENVEKNEKVHLISAGIFRLKNSKFFSEESTTKENASSSCSESNSGILNRRDTMITQGNALLNNEALNEESSTQMENTSPGLPEFSSVAMQREVKKSSSLGKIVVNKALLKAKKNFKAKATAIGMLKAQSNSISAVSSNKERKVTKTLVIVLIVFLVCW